MTDRNCLLADWPAPDNVVALTSLRNADLAQLVGSYMNGADMTRIHQVHGDHVVDAATLNVAGCGGVPDADASFSQSPGLICEIVSADCLPVLFCNSSGDEVAAAHAGWRGLAEGVLESTLKALKSPPNELMAWLGPAISQAHFEVGAEVRECFLTRSDPAISSQIESAFVACRGVAVASGAGARARAGYMADLYGIARARLTLAGISNIYGGDYCTYADEENFYSWRRSRDSGRMHSLIAFF